MTKTTHPALDALRALLVRLPRGFCAVANVAERKMRERAVRDATEAIPQLEALLKERDRLSREASLGRLATQERDRVNAERDELLAALEKAERMMVHPLTVPADVPGWQTTLDAIAKARGESERLEP